MTNQTKRFTLKTAHVLCAIGALGFATPTLASGHGQGLGGLADTVGGSLGGGGGGGIGASASVGGGIGASASVGGGTSSGGNGSIDVAIGGGQSSSPGAGITNPTETAAVTKRALTQKADRGANRVKRGAVRLEDLVGYRVVDVRGQALGLIQNINQSNSGMFAVRLNLVSSMPRDQAVLRFSNLQVSSDEIRLPISKRALRQSLQ